MKIIRKTKICRFINKEKYTENNKKNIQQVSMVINIGKYTEDTKKYWELEVNKGKHFENKRGKV